MNTQTFSQAQTQIVQLQTQIVQLQLKPIFSFTLSDKGGVTVTAAGALVIHKGADFTYCGYFKDLYDLKGHYYRFIYDDRLPESILVDHEQAKNFKAFVKNLGEFFASYKGYNTTYTYNNYIRRLKNKHSTDNIEDSFDTYTALKKAGYKFN